jgi:hypothetical protein
VLERFEINFLEDVGRIDPTAQLGIDPERDDPPEPVAVRGEKGLPAGRVARGGSLQEFVQVGRVTRRVGCHTT